MYEKYYIIEVIKDLNKPGEFLARDERSGGYPALVNMKFAEKFLTKEAAHDFVISAAKVYNWPRSYTIKILAITVTETVEQFNLGFFVSSNETHEYKTIWEYLNSIDPSNSKSLSTKHRYAFDLAMKYYKEGKNPDVYLNEIINKTETKFKGTKNA